MASILIVDDQPQLLDGIQMTLDLAGYHVYIANTGLAALNVLQTQLVDLIITDIEMPQLDGYELCQRVRADMNLNALPLLVLSAHGDEEDMRYAKSLGANDYLLKPIEPEDLLAAVDGWLRAGAGHSRQA